jgi:hypothetical protein
MAIRIDLLPRYVGLRRWFKRLLVACLSLVGAFAAVLFVLYYREQLRLQTLKENRDAYQKVATMADDAQSAAKKATSEAQPFQDTVNFFVNAGRTGPERAALLDTIHRYIYTGAVISSLDISDGQTVKFTAMVKTPDEYANFLNNLRRGTAPAGILFTDLPAGTGIPGYNSGATTTGQNGQTAAQPTPTGGATGGTAPQSVPYVVFPLTINASGKLLNPVVVPTEPGAAAPAPTEGQPGAPAKP